MLVYLSRHIKTKNPSIFPVQHLLLGIQSEGVCRNIMLFLNVISMNGIALLDETENDSATTQKTTGFKLGVG